MLFSVVFSEKLGISDDMSTGYHVMTVVFISALAYYHTPSLLIQSKDGSRMSRFVRLAYFCLGAQGLHLREGPGPQEVLGNA
ncbi:hypothetical protein TNCV_4827391 [Trichonephila clavipes]|uniref:Uncharacterized protein n=1 Tax=Trichonephila clavipes TaxID=2585209 RepID=A0A8X6SNG2_TRICX|nr:hypothetical protein TNCV_4827391 [Trichonephila clavipes]